MTTVEKEQFWTQIVENPSLWGTIQTSDKAFNTQAENIWTVMNETFIKNGSLKEVNRWELMLGDRLENSGEGTLNERKSRILKRITEYPPVTKGVVKESMDKNVSEKFGPVFHSEYDKSTDTFDFVVACKEEDKEAISELVSNVVPKIENVNITYNDLNKYADCATVDDMKLINENYKEDLTTDGEWVYPLPNCTKLSGGWGSGPFSSAKNLKKWHIPLLECTSLSSAFDSTSLMDVDLYAPKCTSLYFSFGGTNITGFNCKIDAKQVTDISYTFTASKGIKNIEIYVERPGYANGFANNAINLMKVSGYISGDGIIEAMYMYENDKNLKTILPDRFPILQKGERLALGCQLTKECAKSILDSIPSYDDGSVHNIGLGIHIDHQTDEEMLAAIENAETKGWTTTIQWNGVASAQTASTFGLRKPMIYAKVVDSQLPNGEPKQDLEWGHYVTNWEENGYQEFSSLDEAYEHFGIEPEV